MADRASAVITLSAPAPVIERSLLRVAGQLWD